MESKAVRIGSRFDVKDLILKLYLLTYLVDTTHSLFAKSLNHT